MPPSRAHGIRPRDESEEDSHSEAVQSSSQHTDASDSEEQFQRNDSASSASVEDEIEDNDLKEVSFGALVAAQAKLQPISRKRKLDEQDDFTGEEPKRGTTISQKEPQDWSAREQNLNRSSKHAPTVLSSRKPVTRRREIFSPPPSEKFRDPRFDSAVTADARRGNTSSTQGASHNYAFLNEYQATEVLDLKSQLKKTKDANQQVDLKRKIMSIEAKLRNAEASRREAEIMREHKRKEREAIKEGKKSKPYFLKHSEIKARIDQERKDAMGKRAKDKSERRKKKREKTKDARDMPRVRRAVG